MPNPADKTIISCGMYAFTHRLRGAWRQILGSLHQHLPAPYSQAFDLRFDDATKILSDPGLFIGQTCGYPYVAKWQHTHDVICVPEFTIDGCENIKCSSWFITRADSGKVSLDEFSNTIAVINNTDSNSGMNVFRYEISKHANSKPFFKNVLVSHSHLESLKLIAQGTADITAIDAVSYHFSTTQALINADNLKIIGQSQHTTGLPFIIHKALEVNQQLIVNALNTSLKAMSPKNKAFLNLKQFTPVDRLDYASIKALETKAEDNGYAVLQ
ncbi:phosphate/phosphite/phosphonate ABC transporter substrate-binding protein [Candidatus Spongiihabitans sp.]|uniref:phosphate/phosphite/phosphonate ABC transporter substrate-binding protein n=1 Tax=Candidatus Spongiihabitans sp. TaxID=3101308 RepID=UPI003C6F5379